MLVVRWQGHQSMLPPLWSGHCFFLLLLPISDSQASTSGNSDNLWSPEFPIKRNGLCIEKRLQDYSLLKHVQDTAPTPAFSSFDKRHLPNSMCLLRGVSKCWEKEQVESFWQHANAPCCYCCRVRQFYCCFPLFFFIEHITYRFILFQGSGTNVQQSFSWQLLASRNCLISQRSDLARSIRYPSTMSVLVVLVFMFP